jgi:hypothetical protein
VLKLKQSPPPPPERDTPLHSAKHNADTERSTLVRSQGEEGQEGEAGGGVGVEFAVDANFASGDSSDHQDRSGDEDNEGAGLKERGGGAAVARRGRGGGRGRGRGRDTKETKGTTLSDVRGRLKAGVCVLQICV